MFLFFTPRTLIVSISKAPQLNQLPFKILLGGDIMATGNKKFKPLTWYFAVVTVIIAAISIVGVIQNLIKLKRTDKIPSFLLSKELDKQLDELRVEINNEMLKLNTSFVELKRTTPVTIEEVKAVNELLKEIDADKLVDISSLTTRLDVLEQGILPFKSPSELDSRLNNMEESIESVSSDISDFKKALNPTKPSEILTIVRLGDKFELLLTHINNLKNDLKDFQAEMDKKIQRNYELVDSNVDRIVGIIKWFGLLFIPIFLNLIRDLFSLREKGKAQKSSAT
jgi:hypothetical protein